MEAAGAVGIPLEELLQEEFVQVLWSFTSFYTFHGCYNCMWAQQADWILVYSCSGADRYAAPASCWSAFLHGRMNGTGPRAEAHGPRHRGRRRGDTCLSTWRER